MSFDLEMTIDAEEYHRKDLHLDICKSIAEDPEFRDWDGFGLVVQSYRRDALETVCAVQTLAQRRGTPIRVRLVKGAYWDSEIKRAQKNSLADYPVFTDKWATDASYLACARYILDNPTTLFAQFATHNAQTVAAILEMSAACAGHYEFQRLFGMGEVLHRRLTDDFGTKTRIYAPVGHHKDLLAYLVRRLLEKGANSSFVQQVLDDETPPTHMAESPFTAMRRDGVTLFPPPRNHLHGERLSALGLDSDLQDHIAQFGRRLSKDTQAQCRSVASSPSEIATAFEHVADPLIHMIKGSMRTLVVGDPSAPETDLGPLIDSDAKRRITDYVRRRRDEGTDIFTVELPMTAPHRFVAPTLIELEDGMDVEEEVFGPVLHARSWACSPLAGTGDPAPDPRREARSTCVAFRGRRQRRAKNETSRSRYCPDCQNGCRARRARPIATP